MRKLVCYVLTFLPLFCLAQKPELIVPIGHTRAVYAIAYSPDGKYIVTGGGDNSAQLWRAEHGEFLHNFKGHTGPVTAIDFSPDGKKVLTTGDFSVKIWDIGSGELLNSLLGHSDEVNTLSCSSDGQFFVTGSDDKTAKIWKVGTETPVNELKGHKKGLLSSAFAPNNKFIATGSEDGLIIIWDATTGAQVTSLSGHKGAVNSLDFSNDGKYLVSGSADKTILVWDASNWAEVQTLKSHGDEVTSVSFSTDSKQLLSTSTNNLAKLWDTNTWQETQSFEPHTMPVTCGAFSPDGTTFCTGGWDKSVKMWHTADISLKHEFKGIAFRISSVAYSPDGQFVMTGGKDPAMKIWNLNAGNLAGTINGHSDEINSVTFSPDGLQFLTGGDITAKLWDFSTSELLYTFEGHKEEVNYADFAPTGQYIATSSADDCTKIWDAKSKKRLHTLFGHKEQVTSVSFSADGKKLITGSKDNSAIIWNSSTGKKSRILKGHEWWVVAVAFSSDGNLVVTGDGNGEVRIWDAKTGAPKHTLKGHFFEITCLDFSPDNAYVFTGSMDQTIKQWDVKTGELFRTFEGHSDEISSLRISPDGKQMVSGSNDNTTKLWDLESATEIATLVAFNEKDWVVTVPNGLFDASPGAMKYMYYVVTYGDEWEIIDLEQLKYRYFEPGLLSKVLGYNEEKIRSVEGLDQVALFPKVSAEIVGDSLHVVMDERNGGLGQLSIFINGKELVHFKNTDEHKDMQYDLRQHKNYLFADPQKNNIVTIQAYNDGGWLTSKPIKLIYKSSRSKGSDSDGPDGWVGKLAPKMYVVTIGTSQYAGDQLDLMYADKDAEGMAEALNAVGTALFSEGDSLEVFCLNTSPPKQPKENLKAIHWRYSTKDSVAHAFKEIKAKAKAEDILVVYFSGHGVTKTIGDHAQFYYLTHEISSEEMLQDQAMLDKYTISSEELTSWINSIPALKQVLIIDACNSGKIVEDLTGTTRNLNSSQIRAMDRMKDRTGMFILSGSAANKVSYEASEFGQGLLTYALLQGMMGVGTRKTSDGQFVDVMTLFQYARDEVPRLAETINGIQKPMLGTPNNGSSFDIGIINSSVKIPIGRKKPVVVRCNFQNEDTFEDDLRIGELLEAALQAETEKGKNADLIYVDVNQYSEAYSLKGRYSKEGDQIKLKVKLFREGSEPRDLDIPANTDPGKIVRLLMLELKDAIAAKS